MRARILLIMTGFSSATGVLMKPNGRTGAIGAWVAVGLLALIAPRETANAASVVLTWDAPATNVDGTAVTALKGFRVYQGSFSGTYPTWQDAGTTNQATVSSLEEGKTYYFAVSAVSAANRESSVSSELTVTVPDATAPTISLPGTLSITATRTASTAPAPAISQYATLRDNCTSNQALVLAQTPAAGALLSVGTNRVTLTVADQAGNTATGSCLVVVAPWVNTAPSMAAPQDIAVQLGSEVRVPLQASDVDQDALTWSVSSGPGACATEKGIAGNAATFCWNASQVGDHNVQIQVSDGTTPTTAEFMIHVSSFVVTSPAADDVLHSGSRVNIAWEGSNALPSRVNVELWNGVRRELSLAEGLPVQGVNSWTTMLPVSLRAGSSFSILVSDAADLGNYSMSSFFTILPLCFNDFNGDGQTDLTVYWPDIGNWYIRSCKDSQTLAMGCNWGFPGSKAVSGDYDGDGVYDLGVYDPASGSWYILSLATGKPIAFGVGWGFQGCIPVPGDYDGDGAFDLAVYHEVSGTWYIRSLRNTSPIAFGTSWGFQGCTPVPGDFDGDGAFDLAVYNRAAGQWYIRSLKSTSPIRFGTSWGFTGCVPISGDFDGDTKTDMAVYWPNGGNWYIYSTGTGSVIKFGESWGFWGCTPVSGDYDGNGASDMTVYYPPTGNWYIRRSNPSKAAAVDILNWGWSAVQPVTPNNY